MLERIDSETARSGDFRIGFDTEFYDVEIGKYSVLGRAKVHFASLAWNNGSGRFHPRGFTIPSAAVVSREVVVGCQRFREAFENPRFVWLAHNAPVDAHTFKNEGINIANVVNTLTLARWTWPSRARSTFTGGGFGLDALGKDVLGEGKLASFDEVFSEVRHIITSVPTRVCACGVEGCRKRRLPEHQKSEGVRDEEKDVVVSVPLRDVGPGHRLFPTAVRYAAQDAVLAKCLDQVITRELNLTYREVPWIKSLES